LKVSYTQPRLPEPLSPDSKAEYTVQASVEIEGSATPWVGDVLVKDLSSKEGGASILTQLTTAAQALGTQHSSAADAVCGAVQQLREDLAEAALGGALEAAGHREAAVAAARQAKGRAMGVAIAARSIVLYLVTHIYI